MLIKQLSTMVLLHVNPSAANCARVWSLQHVAAHRAQLLPLSCRPGCVAARRTSASSSSSTRTRSHADGEQGKPEQPQQQQEVAGDQHAASGTHTPDQQHHGQHEGGTHGARHQLQHRATEKLSFQLLEKV
jgi:hypothetical protein